MRKTPKTPDRRARQEENSPRDDASFASRISRLPQREGWTQDSLGEILTPLSNQQILPGRRTRPWSRRLALRYRFDTAHTQQRIDAIAS